MIRIEGLKKNYPGFALDVSLEVRPGRITGLIGRNGAGKSTVFRSVLNLIRPDGGSAEVFGKPAAALTEQDRQAVGTVLADAFLAGIYTVGDTEKIMRAAYREFDAKAFRDGCAGFGLDPRKKISELSTGMKARLKVLCALTHRARLLLLDEPTAGLDVLARDEILSMIRDYMEQDEERAVLISSHISRDLETLCDDFYMIHDGRILLHEDTDRVLSDYAILKASEEQYAALDRSHLLRVKKESFGWSCLTDQRQYYMENYPETVIEKSGLDELILLMAKGEAA